MFKNLVIRKLQSFLNRLVFVLWTGFLTYKTGPFYAMLELARQYRLFGYPNVPKSDYLNKSLRGKVCVITGGTRGIGIEVVKSMLTRHCTIITGTTNLTNDSSPYEIETFKQKLLKKALSVNEVAKNHYDDIEKRLHVLPLNLTSMDSVIKFCQQIQKQTTQVDYLICNGGVMHVPFKLTENLFETHMAINYYSHCLMIAKLIPLMMTSAINSSKILMVSSGLHHASFGLRLHDLNSIQLYSPYHGYAQSKLAKILFTYRFHSFLQSLSKTTQAKNTKISIDTLHPGVCRTSLMESFVFFRFDFIRSIPIFRSAREGAETILHAALSEECTGGRYFEDCLATKSSSLTYDKSIQQQLWNKTWDNLRPWLTIEEYQLLKSH